MADTKSRTAYKSYIVRNKRTGEEVCRGDSAKCATAMGVSRKNFLTLASNCRLVGHGTWDIETIKPSEIDRDKMQMFMLRLEYGKEPEYPCDGCRWRETCGDARCKNWERWFKYHYTVACIAVRRRAAYGAG